ncbi:unnamed protein product [Phytophthora fragariaefolia]|uniref:Unnamed protein product n=1 Tax=Phytophthora fragariaefolia TaxID=1490495 RepID=A0A9W6XTL9_9STRA|nr:unnamed protein product [Phytophthora fragariaefolia]
MVQLQPRPNVETEKSLAKTDVQLSETEISGTSDSEGIESREAKLIEENGDEDSDSDDETFYDAISFDGDDEDRCMQMSAEELILEPAVYIREGSELLAQLRDELAMLPELRELSSECNINKADVGDPGRTTPAEEEKLRTRLRCHHRIFLGDGNAAPAPTREVWCDLDVGDVKPVAHRPRSIAPHLAIKVYELMKKLLETGLIEHSGSPWSSPIVIVLKKNGVDIQMCIDYRVVNGFIQLSNYPLPLIDDLLIGFASAMWFMSLDMASGFWVIRMTERAKLIPAFFCSFGHFQWVDQDVLEFLGLDPSRREESGSQVFALTHTVMVFQMNIPAPASMGPVLGRSSYIDDIAHSAPTWDQQWDDLDALLFCLRYWNMSVRAEDLSFPKTQKGVQSLLGSLNYYHKFIEDFPVVAVVLYELSDDQVRSERDLTRAKAAFEIPKKKIVSTPLLRHPDRSKPFVIIPHANRWAACAVLGQEYDGKIQPVRFTGRVLNDAELRYHIAEKEVIAVLRVLQVFRTLLEGCRLEVYTRHFVFKWILQSKTADGRCVPWRVMLSHLDITVRKGQRDEDGLAAIMGAGITPESIWKKSQRTVLSFDGAAKTSTRRGSCGCTLWQLPGWKVLEARGFILDDVSANDAEYNGLLKGVQMALDRQVEILVVVGDSRIVIQQVQGLINCHQPNLPKHLAECEVQKEKFRTLRLVHVKREYNQGADYLMSKPLTVGKSWIVQDPEELLHLERVSKIAEKLMKPKVVLLHGASPQNSERLGLPSKTRDKTRQSPEVIVDAPPGEEEPRRPMTPLEYQTERWRRIRVHQKQDIYLSEIKSVLKGDIGRFSPRRLRKISKVADLFALDARGVLYRLARSTRGRPRDLVDERRLVIPDVLRSNMLHYAHEDFQGGHQVYEECVFRRFGASSVVRHDQDPKFMSEVFTRYRKVLGSTQRATLANRPQANGQQERSVQTVVRRDLQKKAKRQRSEAQTQKWKELSERLKSGFEKGDSVWLYIHKVQPGLSRKPAHMWHGTFRIEEVHDDFRVKLKVTDSGYRVNPWVHVSRLKPPARFPKRPTVEIEVAEDDDFDTAILSEARFQTMQARDDHPRA